MDPIERKITNIIKGINGANPSKLKAINEAGRGDAGASSSASATVYGNATPQINAENQALQEQTRTIVPLNEQWDKYNKVLSETKTALLDYTREINIVSDYFKEYNKHTTQAKVNMTEYNEALKEL